MWMLARPLTSQWQSARTRRPIGGVEDTVGVQGWGQEGGRVGWSTAR